MTIGHIANAGRGDSGLTRELPEAPASPLRVEVLAVLAFCAFLFFYGLGSFGLLGADEPRYAQIAREMLARQDWVVPVLNGTPWLEKPVLYYWGAMLSYSVFGVSDWAARVPSALLATLMVMGAYAFLRRFRPGAQLDAALIMASAAGTIGFGRGASTDMPLTATFALAVLAWYTWFRSARRGWLVAFYAAIGLATLAKGPVAPALAGAVLVLFALLQRDGSIIRRTLWLPGMLVFLAVAVPWYVLVELRTGEFFRVFVLEHTLLRFGTNMFRHHQPFWYYAPVVLLVLLPWTVFALSAVGAALRRIWRQVRGEGPRADPLPDFLLLWLAVPLAVFSISQSKLPGYILPGIPAATLLLAFFLPDWESRRPRMAVILLHAISCGVLLAAALLSPSLALKTRPGEAALAVAMVAGALMAAAIAVTLRRHGLRVLRFVTLVPVVVGMAWVLQMAAPAVDLAGSARPVSADLARLETERTRLATYHVRRDLEYGLNFYRNEAIASYDRGEIPEADHLLVSRGVSLGALESLLPNRRFSRVGGFPAQRLDYYWVSPRHDESTHGEAGHHHDGSGDGPGMEGQQPAMDHQHH